jgi:predicted dehydrogenase/threonine dehydrogenase-like Zn-dependent dehydrogenase
MLVDFGRAGWLQKARSQPDKVRQVLQKVKTDGITTTMEAVRAKLDQPISLGYCAAGVVTDVGRAARGFTEGDRVVTNGPHAEYVRIPHTLAARIPDGVSMEAAAFTPLAAIGLQGIRLAQPTLGETVVVYGLGLIGLLTLQLARANGCRVIGIDRASDRLALAEQFGGIPVSADSGELAVARVLELTGGVGADAVLLALATSQDEPMHFAAAMSRKRGRLVLIGVTGLKLARDDFYKKELSFQVSCSYGPGRYDPAYEEGGGDYPLPFVRWTEQRNFDACLALMADGRLNPQPLISHRFSLDNTQQAYELVAGGGPSLGIVLEYPPEAHPVSHEVQVQRADALPAGARIGWIGAGNFSTRTLIPAFKAGGAILEGIASSGGVSASIAAREHGFVRAMSDAASLVADDRVDTLVVATRHDSHASWASRALRSGKHVFVEKPLSITEESLGEVMAAARASGCVLTVGFNRRFAPLTLALRKALTNRGARAITITVNAGRIPREHWTQDPVTGGGRIIGEACHFVDLARSIAGAPISTVAVVSSRQDDALPIDDITVISMAFSNGSVASIQYFANGHPSVPKERVEVYAGGTVAVIENWRRLRVFGARGGSGLLSQPQDKGHRACAAAFLHAVRDGGPLPIPLDELEEVSRWSIRAADLARGLTISGA